MALFNGMNDAYFEYLVYQELMLLRQEEMKNNQSNEDPNEDLYEDSYEDTYEDLCEDL